MDYEINKEMCELARAWAVIVKEYPKLRGDDMNWSSALHAIEERVFKLSKL